MSKGGPKDNPYCPRGIYDCDCGAEYCEQRKPRAGMKKPPHPVKNATAS